MKPVWWNSKGLRRESVQTTNWVTFSELHRQKTHFCGFLLDQKTMLISPGLFGSISVNIESLLLQLLIWCWCFPSRIRNLRLSLEVHFSGWGSAARYASINSNGWRTAAFPALFLVLRTENLLSLHALLLGKCEIKTPHSIPGPWELCPVPRAQHQMYTLGHRPGSLLKPWWPWLQPGTQLCETQEAQSCQMSLLWENGRSFGARRSTSYWPDGSGGLQGVVLMLSVQIRHRGACWTRFVPAGRLMDLGSELLCDDRKENWCRVASIKQQLLKCVRITAKWATWSFCLDFCPLQLEHGEMLLFLF